MSFCNQCGTKLPDGAKFCANCGAAVAGGEAAATTIGSVHGSDVGTRRDRPTLDAPTARSSVSQPIVSGVRGGTGWILPALVAVAVVVIGYLLLVPRTTPGAGMPGAAAVADGANTRQAAAPDRRAVDEASDAATVAGANTGARNSVSAAVLDSAFNSDPAGAAARYAGPVRVSGTIATMVQPGPTPSLSLEGRTRFNFMIVEFPEGYRTRLAPLAKGQFISVACDQVRALGGTTILSGCLLA